MNRQLFRSVFRPTTLEGTCEFSPVTSLTNTFDSASIDTPCKRLSLSSITSEDTLFNIDLPLDFDNPSFWQVSPDKENQITPAPSRKRRRDSETPFRQLQNFTMECSPSPHNKHKKARNHSAIKCEFTSPDSRDSGFSESETKLMPYITLPKLNLDSSPPKIECLTSDTEERQFRSFAGFSRTTTEDEFLMDVISDTPKPANFDNLMSAPFTSETTTHYLPIRRCLSMLDSCTPSRPLAVSSPRKDIQSNQFKRPCSPVESCPKRRKLNSDCNSFECQIVSPVIVRQSPLVPNSFKSPRMQRSVSDSHLAIMKALNKSENNRGKLTSDFSRPLALPILQVCRNPELKTINAETMANLLRGSFKSCVESYTIADCRYPYEYNGGHIEGAINWPNLECADVLFNSMSGSPEIPPAESTRKIIIFHCEFSAERAPKAHRYLRGMDRTVNGEHYPALHFPEMYILEGGYKSFFSLYPELCSPQSYTKMLDRNHSQTMKFYRNKSRVFSNDSKFGKGRCTVGRSIKRFEITLNKH